MRFIDRAFAITLVTFALGATCGFFFFLTVPTLHEGMNALLYARVALPILAASSVGKTAILLLVFFNNLLPVGLSFLYPTILNRTKWNTSARTLRRLNAAFSILTGFLLGFIDLGGILAFALNLGRSVLDTLVAKSWLHAPIEFFFVLIAVSEPLRLTIGKNKRSLRDDRELLLICLVGLFVSALIEVYLNL